MNGGSVGRAIGRSRIYISGRFRPFPGDRDRTNLRATRDRNDIRGGRDDHQARAHDRGRAAGRQHGRAAGVRGSGSRPRRDARPHEEHDDLRLDLSKFILDAPAKKLSTKGTGFATARFRTQGDLQLTVTSPEGPRPYRLLVWAGNEATPAVPSLFTAADSTGEASGGPPMMWIIAGLLAVIAALLGALVLKRGRS